MFEGADGGDRRHLGLASSGPGRTVACSCGNIEQKHFKVKGELMHTTTCCPGRAAQILKVSPEEILEVLSGLSIGN